MENPAPTPGRPGKPGKNPTSWLRRALAISALLLAGVCLFLYLQPSPPAGAPDPRFQPVNAITLATLPLATRFDMPMGTEDGALVYNAQPFTENHHLGDDLNGIGGENTDLGDPVYSIANGRVLYVGWPADGWGNLILVMHAYEENGQRRFLQAAYAHLDQTAVKTGDLLQRGQKIATVGTAGGRYLAHLHLELREFRTPFIGAGYRADPSGWVDPSGFIQKHRGAPAGDLRPEPKRPD